MTFYTLTRTDGPGPWDYPTLGFTAVNGAVPGTWKTFGAISA